MATNHSAEPATAPPRETRDDTGAYQARLARAGRPDNRDEAAFGTRSVETREQVVDEAVTSEEVGRVGLVERS